MLIGISDQMGTRFDRLRYEVFQNLILSPMNTGSVRPAVATTPTACGIETGHSIFYCLRRKCSVATTPTACGIETERLQKVYGQRYLCCNNTYRLRY